jgi:hypothetical protein
MKTVTQKLTITVLCILLFYSPIFKVDLRSEELSQNDYTLLKVCEGIIQLFKQYPDSIWPGYNLSERPFMVYMPGKYALLFNYPKNIDGFTPYPADWPDLGTKVQFYGGQYKDLAGQLAFELSIDSVKVAAVPFMEKSEVDLFGFIVHENFHQFQFRAFGEIPWEREERYPIEDKENTALAYLEMRLLMDALSSAYADKREQTEEYLRQFVAVRNYRWQKGDPFIARYEQGEEINEGTAKYVEIKGTALMRQPKYKSSLSGLTSPLSEDFSSISMPGYFLEDFQKRITGNSISPEDVPRNRIYPVGSAQGFLLDYLRIDWKNQAQKAGEEFIFAKLFKEYLGIDESQYDSLLTKAKKHYNYENVLASADSLILEYLDGYKKELKSFETQAGYRVEIDLSSKNLRRSRSSSAKKWIVDQGTKEFRNHYNIYDLENKDLLMQLHDSGLLEENDWDKRIKKVVFFIPEINSISLDGEPFELKEGIQYQFNNIEMLEENLKLSYSKVGKITLSGHKVWIDLMPESILER